jgi:hypothetical protein
MSLVDQTRCTVALDTPTCLAIERVLHRPKQQNALKDCGIYDVLVAQGYTFTSKEAKKVLGIRLYKMLGVEPLGERLEAK